MKRLFTALFTAAAFLLTATAFAGNLDDYPEIRDALNNDNMVLYSYWGCLEDGYGNTDVNVQPINYFVEPQGDHLEANVTITMNRNEGGNSLETHYVTITVEINSDGEANITCGDMTVKRDTVY